MLFFWLQREGSFFDEQLAKNKASAAAISINASQIITVRITAREMSGEYTAALPFFADIPTEWSISNAFIYEDTKRMKSRKISANSSLVNSGNLRNSAEITKKVGRNDPCPCGSGKKYKKCHGS